MPTQIQSRPNQLSKAPTNTTMTTSEGQDIKKSTIVNFYSGKCVLLTGATGFLGKVILWKLLDTCQDISKIYVLMRSKKDMSAQKRLAQLLDGKPFNFKHRNTSHFQQKVVALEGDVTQEGLGLSQQDRQLLVDSVNVVLHSAASVKFDAPLKDNLRDNYYGTRAMVGLLDQIRNLNAFVHVSTAYSNYQQHTVHEDIVPLEKDYDKAVKIIENLSAEACESAWPRLVEGRPNTYCYTKALAEHLVATQEGRYPISIVRPSIIISSAVEPCPGWVDNVNGISGLGSLAAIGVLRTIDWNYYAISDMVPCDYVANNVIAAAYQVAAHSPKKLLIYNMTSGNMNPISWGSFFDKLRAAAVDTPPEKIVRPMIHAPRYRRANKLSFMMTQIFSELFFAYFVDLLLTLLGYKKIMVKITRKMHHGYRILKPFTSREWDFRSDNVVALSESLPEIDRKVFFFDMRNFDWDQQAKVAWTKGRLYLLRESESEKSVAIGRRRQKIVTVVHYGFIYALLALVVCLSYSRVTGLLRA